MIFIVFIIPEVRIGQVYSRSAGLPDHIHDPYWLSANGGRKTWGKRRGENRGKKSEKREKDIHVNPFPKSYFQAAVTGKKKSPM